ncbi:PHP domain-containing protein [Kitasatospora sp. YST-16]|uniref:PHP domain-containing protein n=1 Tax=Kitasatospora sp. YST-16 TaxID=2998080 RepID=UPI0022852B81|nr:PHP domain-containing protein [Kitasatospora sp. YST-16]WAL70702.1 PHP domain-containing protein [Kitasatospora sp. YST-16]WNW36741.1 PHP domain-containing protein [Streptomyces sp. Li-HN-5-13]
MTTGQLPALTADLHTHTDFSDGRDPLEAVLAAAGAAGLRTVVVADHVRADSVHLPAYTAAVRAARAAAPLRVVCGVEAKILDTAGRIDLPDDLTGVEHVALADHRFPLPDGPAHPEQVRERLATGALTPARARRLLLTATTRAVSRLPAGRTAHLAHLFSVLPKCGLAEADLEATELAPLARACRARGVAVELNEKWRCPSPRTAAALAAAGVRLAAGSDAHRAADVGDFDWVGRALPTALAEARR